jgi:hypothetical protein
MEWIMNNINASQACKNCEDELVSIGNIKNMVGATSPIMLFLTRYAIIKACGAIELSYKTIIADFCEQEQSQQIKNLLSVKVRNAANNPTLDNMYRSLSDFDESWKELFKQQLQVMQDKDRCCVSLSSLNDLRNDFAHGGSPAPSFEDVERYFKDSIKIIEILDGVVFSSTSTIIPLTSNNQNTQEGLSE